MIEIRVRRFYKCDMGEVVPSRTYTIDETAKEPPPFDILAAVEKLGADVKDFPGKNLRLMTESEVDEYCETEDGEFVEAST